MKRIIFILLTFVLCSCSTPYQRRGLMGGYSETQLSANVFSVSFAGNGNTSKKKVMDFALLRAAELMAQNGYPYFIIQDNFTDTDTSIHTTPTMVNSSTYGNSYSSLHGNTSTFGNTTSFGGSMNTYENAYSSTFISGGKTYEVNRYDNNITAIGFVNKPNYKGMIYETFFVINSVCNTYNLKSILQKYY